MFYENRCLYLPQLLKYQVKKTWHEWSPLITDNPVTGFMGNNPFTWARFQLNWEEREATNPNRVRGTGSLHRETHYLEVDYRLIFLIVMICKQRGIPCSRQESMSEIDHDSVILSLGLSSIPYVNHTRPSIRQCDTYQMWYVQFTYSLLYYGYVISNQWIHLIYWPVFCRRLASQLLQSCDNIDCPCASEIMKLPRRIWVKMAMGRKNDKT